VQQVDQSAVLAEQSLRANPLRVQLVEQRRCVLRKGSSPDDDFKVLSHLLYEFVVTRSDGNKHHKLARIHQDFKF
jgi:hypothetical protein